MNVTIKNSVLKAYQKTKKFIDSLDEHKIINQKDIESHFPSIEEVCTYYEREYEGIVKNPKDDIETFQKSTYSVIKTFMHLRFFTADEDKVNEIYKEGKRLPLGLVYTNEILCWNILMNIYDVFIEAIQGKHQALEYSPYCELHFEETMKSVVTTLFRSRNRLSDITPSYIQLLFDLLLQMHSNISANLVGKLLNRSGFMTYLSYWGTKKGTLCLMNCDLDKFKQVNDDNSHAMGDIVLCKVADVLSAVCKKHSGIPARVGGEEFWLAFFGQEQTKSDKAKQKLAQIFNEIQKELKKIERPNPNQKCLSENEYKEWMTMSAAGGIVPMPTGYDREHVAKWFEQLDDGLKEMKQKGRDDYKFVSLALTHTKNSFWTSSAEESTQS